MIEGFWTAIFSSGKLSGGGVVYLCGGNLVGGDSQYFYLGTYHFDTQSHRLSAQIKVIAFVSGAVSVFGVPANLFEVRLDGNVSGSTATAQGFVAQAPSLTFTVQLVKRTGPMSPASGGIGTPFDPWSSQNLGHNLPR